MPINSEITALAILAVIAIAFTKVASEIVRWFMRRSEKKDEVIFAQAEQIAILTERAVKAMDENSKQSKRLTDAIKELSIFWKRLNGRITEATIDVMSSGPPKRRDEDRPEK